MKKTILVFCLALAPAVGAAPADLPRPQVAPWDGHKAAASLTFDDSDPSHLDVVIPELERRGLRGTFFLIANRTDRKADWRKALQAGQELGNHSLDHLHPAGLTPEEEKSQVAGAQTVLQNAFGVPFLTFAYPYTEITPGLLNWVKQTSFLARGGYGDYYMKPDSTPDWYNIPAQVTMTDLPFSTYQGWIDQDFKEGAWMVFMIHGLEGTPWGWQPITKVVFNQILDALQAKDIWVDTFSNVGGYWRAQKIFEAVTPLPEDGGLKWSWTRPQPFPGGILLKLRLPEGSPDEALYQGSDRLKPDAQGFYSLSFDQGELEEKPLAP